MENLELLKAKEEIARLEEKIEEMNRKTNLEIRVSTQSVLEQLSSCALLEELMRREYSREELEKISLGFFMKKMEIHDCVISGVFEYLTSRGLFKKEKLKEKQKMESEKKA